eukprot:405101-Pyramimonas_sp.AAC.1
MPVMFILAHSRRVVRSWCLGLLTIRLKSGIFLDDARPPPTDPLGDASRRPLAALGLSDRLARPGNVNEESGIISQ